MFVTRLLTVVIALPIFIAALLFLPQQLWGLVLLPVLAIASWEWAGLAGYHAGARIAYAMILVASAVVLFYLAPRASGWPVRVDIAVYTLSCVFWLAVAPIWLGAGWATRNPLLLAFAGWIALVPMWLALVQLQTAPWA
jgi:phosphatidate cytidylyltransferase